MAAVLGTAVVTVGFPVGLLTTDVGAGPGGGCVTRRQCTSVRLVSARTMIIPVVVDTGGPSDTAEVACVTVPVGSNGAQVLTARAKLLGVPAPRYAESGLLCAIDGFPATGCGVQNGSHYAYWAYYHGGSSWTYASVGPASWKVSAGDVEGWRFQPEGSATPADPHPGPLRKRGSSALRPPPPRPRPPRPRARPPRHRLRSRPLPGPHPVAPFPGHRRRR